MAKFDTTPKPAFLKALRNQRWTSYGAIAELIDNSFGSGRGDATSVEITYDAIERTLTVFDNGRGMDHLGRLFQLGNTIGRSPGDIGEYGSGGTWAILWLPDIVEVWTMRNKRICYDKVAWKEYLDGTAFPQVSDTWLPPNKIRAPNILTDCGHGTYIKLHLRRERQINVGVIQRELAEIFAPAPRHGKELLWVNITKTGNRNEVALAADWDLPMKEWHDFDIVLELPNGDMLPVQGKIGIVEDLPYSKSLVAVGFSHRVITKTRDCFSSKDGSERYVGNGVAGWLDLGDGWQPYLATTKDEMNDAPAWAHLMAYAFDQIKHLLKKTEHRELSLILDGLAMTLEAAFNNSNEFQVPVKVTLGESGKSESSNGGFAENSRPGPVPAIPPIPGPSDDVGEEEEKQFPPRWEIAILQVKDGSIDGALCRLDPYSTKTSAMVIEVNEDHDIIKECLRARPPNNVALQLLLTREVAAALINHENLGEKALPPRVLKQLDPHTRPHRERILARVLMDRVYRAG